MKNVIEKKFIKFKKRDYSDFAAEVNLAFVMQHYVFCALVPRGML